MRKNLSFLFQAILLLSCATFLAACSKGESKKSPAPVKTTMEPQEEGDAGSYRAALRPLNMEVAGTSAGSAEVVIEGDDISIETMLKDTPAGVKHYQFIMKGSECPDFNDDSNLDGIIDIREAMSKTGKFFIPLDSNLSEQIAGMDYGPISNGSGAFVYRRSTTLSMLLSDLNAPDPDRYDHLVKLPIGDDLKLNQKVVLILGVAKSTELTDTVSGVDNFSQHESLPIACGKLMRVSSEAIR